MIHTRCMFHIRIYESLSMGFVCSSFVLYPYSIKWVGRARKIVIAIESLTISFQITKKGKHCWIPLIYNFNNSLLYHCFTYRFGFIDNKIYTNHFCFNPDLFYLFTSLYCIGTYVLNVDFSMKQLSFRQCTFSSALTHTKIP